MKTKRALEREEERDRKGGEVVDVVDDYIDSSFRNSTTSRGRPAPVDVRATFENKKGPHSGRARSLDASARSLFEFYCGERNRTERVV